MCGKIYSISIIVCMTLIDSDNINLSLGGECMKGDQLNELKSWIKLVLITLLVSWFVINFIVSSTKIEGSSMEPTLSNSDYLLVEKVSYRFTNPKRFDVVIFHATEEKDYIKRIIGLPGETIEFKDDQLYVNGQYIEEPYLTEAIIQSNSQYTHDFTLSEDIDGNYQTIPEGYYLVLGDNRPNSSDSRKGIKSVGLISENDIVGKAMVVYWPFQRIKLIK